MSVAEKLDARALRHSSLSRNARSMALPPHPYAHTLCPALTPAHESPADRADRLERVPQRFLDALFIAFQSEKGRAGFAYDLRWCAGLCTATWREEALWNGLGRVRRGWRNITHLMYAAGRTGDVARVRWLLARGASVNVKTYDGRTALHYASACGNAEIVQLLLAEGANVDPWTPPAAILDPFADPFAVVKVSAPIYEAAQNGHVDVIRVLLAAGADTMSTGMSGCSARVVFKKRHPCLTWPAP
jgi:hypothetical protein